ncbi:SDR family oxidoreductase [Brooklawnia cerclae]|uniref:NAD(P)-dependent dehydrogenase (Short-subunit alcohol dehydrogenase family) n=1 Tax=Brooklawnia cerclae TaxID=349934 RepID=A0ABX0SJ52_9ACTN|nr:glucose 1-dehydrogenase [Brooklawnia cerclae]NIH56782.1 NAD(P)-dependent dehydrogenase (short-subunit alcohol dehydrogenase family) [Brooklawnia cerclae]
MTQQTLDFSGKTVVVTGGSTGIGKATAIAFGRAGANVVIASRGDGGDAAAEAVTASGGHGIFVPIDVSREEDLARLVQVTLDEFGRLDVAFNNAGSLPPTGALVEQSIEAWNRTIAVDLTGVFLSMKHEIPAMLAHGGGSIINTSSVAGLIADPGMAPYAAAKHGVIGLTKAAALDYAQQGIRVNAIAPGLVRTPMIDGWLADPAMRETVLSYSPQGRVSEPEEIAGVVLFLASDLASFVNGAVYPIDGGQTAH